MLIVGVGGELFEYFSLVYQFSSISSYEMERYRRLLKISYLDHVTKAGPRSGIGKSVGHLTRKSGVLGSIPGLATYFRFSFRFFKKGSCQLLAKVCARSTG